MTVDRGSAKGIKALSRSLGDSAATLPIRAGRRIRTVANSGDDMQLYDLRVTVDRILDTTHFYRGDATSENELIGVLFLCRAENKDAFQRSEVEA